MAILNKVKTPSGGAGLYAYTGRRRSEIPSRLRRFALWQNGNVRYAAISMIRKRVTLMGGLLRAHLSRRYPMTGPALCAVQRRTCSRRYRLIMREKGIPSLSPCKAPDGRCGNTPGEYMSSLVVRIGGDALSRYGYAHKSRWKHEKTISPVV